jgi:hypothetical protein
MADDQDSPHLLEVYLKDEAKPLTEVYPSRSEAEAALARLNADLRTHAHATTAGGGILIAKQFFKGAAVRPQRRPSIS